MKNAIQASEAKLLLKVEKEIRKVQLLEKKNWFSREKLLIVEQNTTNNNLIIYGLNKHLTDIKVDLICDRIEILEVPLINFRHWERISSFQIRTYFTSYKEENSKKLPKKRIEIENDLTTIQGEEH